MSTSPIPESQWEWFGYPAHFCGSRDCRFHLSTQIGGHLISTVGDWHPRDDPRRHHLGSGQFYETAVFFTTQRFARCGCPKQKGSLAVDGERYSGHKHAREGHYAMCRKYATIGARIAARVSK